MVPHLRRARSTLMRAARWMLPLMLAWFGCASGALPPSDALNASDARDGALACDAVSGLDALDGGACSCGLCPDGGPGFIPSTCPGGLCMVCRADDDHAQDHSG